MIVVTECVYSHTECVCIYTYVKDTCFSVYCYLYTLMYFLLQDGNAKLSPSLVSLFKGMHAAFVPLCVCEKNVLTSHS